MLLTAIVLSLAACSNDYGEHVAKGEKVFNRLDSLNKSMLGTWQQDSIYRADSLILQAKMNRSNLDTLARYVKHSKEGATHLWGLSFEKWTILTALVGTLVVLFIGYLNIRRARELKKAEVMLDFQKRYQELIREEDELMYSYEVEKYYERFWGLQHYQYTFWRQKYINDSTYQYYMYRRLKQFEEKSIRGISFTNGWLYSRPTFDNTDFVKFIDDLRAIDINKSKDNVLKNIDEHLLLSKVSWDENFKKRFRRWRKKRKLKKAKRKG